MNNRYYFGSLTSAFIDTSVNCSGVYRFSTGNQSTFYQLIYREDLLKTVCKAYIHDKREGLTEREAMIAHLAGYDVADSEGDFWGHDDDYSDTGLNLNYTPHRIIEPDPAATIEIPISRLQALEAEIKELKAQKGCE